MVAKLRSVPYPTRVVMAGVFLMALVASLVVFEWLDRHWSASSAGPVEPVSMRARLPAHAPDEWAFWDQMTSAFSVEPVPTDLLDGPGVVFRWWFDSTYVGGDVIPRDCGGITLWLGEFERYGFDDGAAFVASRSGPCPVA